MGKNDRAKAALQARKGAAPYSKLKKDPGVPRLTVLKKRERQHDAKHVKPAADTSMAPPQPPSAIIMSLAFASSSSVPYDEDIQNSSSSRSGMKDSTVAAHAHQFKKVLELSDVIIQVLDARDPMGCRSRVVEEEVKRAQGDKMMILALNKTDLVPKENVLAWLRYLRHDFPTIPLKSSPTNSHHTRPSSSTKGHGAQGAPHLLTLLKSYRRAHTSLTVGVVGPPNVGKSSLINALSRLRAPSNNNKDVVTVGAKAGETRAIKEVGLEKGLKVLDMPGIVWGDFLGDSTTGAQSVASLNMMSVEYLDDPVAAVDAIVSRVEPQVLQSLYNIPAFANATEFLTMVALSRGRLGKGGAPDHLASARSVLNDWNAGTIPYHTVPPKYHTSSVPSIPRVPAGTDTSVALAEVDGSSLLTSAANVGQAEYVNKFSEPFDLEGLFALGDKDVLDDSQKEHMEMEDLDGDRQNKQDSIEEDEPSATITIPTSRNKRTLSPTPSTITSFTHNETNTDAVSAANTRRVRVPKPKRVRYNPSAPIMFDAMEVNAMSVANPLNRKRIREEAKRRKRGGLSGTDGMLVDDDAWEGTMPPLNGTTEASFKPSGGAFALLAAVDIPLPDNSSEEEDL